MELLCKDNLTDVGCGFLRYHDLYTTSYDTYENRPATRSIPARNHTRCFGARSDDYHPAAAESRREQHASHHQRQAPYACAFCKKCAGRLLFSDRKKLSARLTEVRERYATLQKRPYRIIYWAPENFPKYGMQRPKASGRINTARLLPQELYEQIVGVFQTWKLQPSAG